MPWQERASCLAVIADGLGRCMASRYTAYSQDLWRVAAAAFNTIVVAGLPAVNIVYANGDVPPPPETWAALAHAFEW